MIVVARDHIMPFRRNVFGIARRGDTEITVYDPEPQPGIGDTIVILWADKKRRPAFGEITKIEVGSGKRKVSLLAYGRYLGTADKLEDVFPQLVLGPKDIMAREIGTFHPCRGGGYGPLKEGWPDEYVSLPDGHDTARTMEEWERAQVFDVPNPANSPWPKWERLQVDALAPIGPDSWIVATNGRMTCLGKVTELEQSFAIVDVTTDKRVRLGKGHQPYYGTVIGMSRGAVIRKHRPQK